PSVLSKVKEVKTLSEQKGLTDLLIEIDGGVNVETAKSCKEAGANLLVAGSAVYGKDDRAAAIQAIREA
ncbi:MAG: ribulose-phosphate 3-epimerase, partial [Bacillus sp. (in: Bacteria)]|nr:ribulose-phosphate 3-epimerase [Bacillus sp. (in: firmicutes)]